MRTIKFRAWDKKYKEMASFEKMMSCRPLAITEGLDPSQFIVLPYHENVILMQFTGFHDKNNNGVYEGDRWGNVSGLSMSAVVVFHEGCWSLKWDNGSIGNLHAHVITKSGEVIGNIHENHELC